MKRKVTIQQIADAVSMSKYAVSRALSGKSGVSNETRALIVKTAQLMGYNLRNTPLTQDRPAYDDPSKKHIQTVLVLFPSIAYQNKESVYWGPIFEGISNRLNDFNINILTLTEPAQHSIFTLLNPDAIQGVIVVGSVSHATLVDLKELNIPMVIVDHLDDAILCDTIFVDNYIAINTIMKDLLSKGYKDYQFIGQIYTAHSFFERWLSFKNAIDEHQLALNQVRALLSFDLHLKPVVKEVYKHAPLPEVFICANDVYALYTKEALDELGYTINKDYVMTGFDNTNTELPLYATVNVPKEELGKGAVDQLIWRIDNTTSPFERKLLHANVIFN